MPGKKDQERKEKGEKHGRHHRHHHHKSHRGKPVDHAASAAAAAAVMEEDEEDWNANRQRVERICQTPPNNVCNDCNSNGTRWASVNHGVFLCIRCSGIHRSLGVHVSRVKSTNMDKWSGAEVDLMEAIGNQRGKLMYEARLPRGVKPMSSAEPEAVLRSFVRQKYEEKAFAVDDVQENLSRYYRQTRYGKKATGKSAGSRSHGQGEDNGQEKSIRQREDAVKELYGVNAESISKRSRKPKTIHGTFGVVNVPPEEYEERLRALLAHFLHGMELPAATAVE